MTLRERIDGDTKIALKAHDELRVSVLRMLAAAIHNRVIEKRAKGGSDSEVSDEEVMSAIRAELKKRSDAIEAYDKAGRRDSAERERSEAEILRAFLPPDMSDDELTKIVRGGINATGTTSLKDSGKLMGWVMQRVNGQATGDRVRQFVARELPQA